MFYKNLSMQNITLSKIYEFIYKTKKQIQIKAIFQNLIYNQIIT